MRNSCGMGLFILLIIRSTGACEITSDQLVGGYGYLEGDTLYEEFSLEADGRFHSWLHQRPENSGQWRYQGCKIYIEYDDADSLEIVTPISVNEKQGVFMFNKLSVPATFERYK